MPLGLTRGPTRSASPMDARVKPEQIKLEEECRNFSLDTRNKCCYMSPIPSPEGACSRPPGSRGEGAAPAPVGARQACSPGGTTVPIVPGVSSDHPSGTTTGAPRGLKKCGLETFRRRVGAPVRRTFYSSVLSGAPSPLVPSWTVVQAADGAWADCRRGPAEMRDDLTIDDLGLDPRTHEARAFKPRPWVLGSSPSKSRLRKEISLDLTMMGRSIYM